MKAIWNGTVIAESNDTVVVEGNHYFPHAAVQQRTCKPATTRRFARGKAPRITIP
jgi:uncharacterized protein (DUF427 family)